MSLLRRCSLVLAALLVATGAAAAPPAAKTAKPKQTRPAPPKTAKLEPRTRRAPPSKSVGSPTDGRLIGGARVTEGPHLRIVPFYAPREARWGVDSLVTAIDQAARAVRKQFPGSVLSVGELSRKGGGAIDRHASHESGRDADIAFYVKNKQGKPVYAEHFVPFKGDGTAPTWPGAEFDDARNWALIASIVSNPRARVSHIFVSQPIRARLLAHAQKIGAPASVRNRAAAVMMQPRGALPHDDHFHVRISCPPGADRGPKRCVEVPLPRRRPNEAVARAKGGEAPPKAPAARERTARATPRRAPATKPATPTPAPAPPPAARPEPEASKSEGFIPNLAPIVPGLDSVVIAAPLAGPRPPERPAPAREPIDDPDGVLEED